MKELITAYVNECFDQMVEDLKEFASIPAPSLCEIKRRNWLLSFLQDRLQIQGKTDAAGNVIYLYGESSSKAMRAVLAHMDVVFDEMDSLEIIEQDGLLKGGGIGDDSANVIASLYLLQFLLKYQIELPYQLLFVFDVGEEGLGNLTGSKQILSDYPNIQEVAALDLESDRCVVTGVGSYRYQMKVHAKGGHSYNDYGNSNAIVDAAKLIMCLDELKVGTNGKSTKNIGLIHGGTSINTIADACELYFEMRSDHVSDLSEMKMQFQEIINNVKKQGIEVDVVMVGDRPCGSVSDEQMAVLKDRLVAVHDEFQVPPPCFVSGSTDCNPFLHANIPAICFGCYEGGNAHTKEEWLNIESMRIGVAMVIAYFLK